MKVTLNSFSRIISTALLASSLSLVACSDSDDNDKAAPAPAAQGGAAVTGETSTGQTGNGTTTTTTTSTDGSATTGTTTTGTTTGTTTDGGTTLTNNGKIDCEAAWKKYVVANPVGLELGYKITSVVKGTDGAQISSSETTTTQKVTSSSDVEVTTSTTADIGFGLPATESSFSLTKVQFIEGCGSVEVPNNTTVTILDQSAQTITVPAGTFATNYTKTQISAGNSIASVWIMADGGNIVVKSESQSEIPGFGTSVSTMELVKLVRP